MWCRSLHLLCLHKASVFPSLTHWGWVTHVCVGKQGHHWFRYGLLPVRLKAIIWTNAGKKLMWLVGTRPMGKLIVIWIKTQPFLTTLNLTLKTSSCRMAAICLSINVLRGSQRGLIEDITHTNKWSFTGKVELYSVAWNFFVLCTQDTIAKRLGSGSEMTRKLLP